MLLSLSKIIYIPKLEIWFLPNLICHRPYLPQCFPNLSIIRIIISIYKAKQCWSQLSSPSSKSMHSFRGSVWSISMFIITSASIPIPVPVMPIIDSTNPKKSSRGSTWPTSRSTWGLSASTSRSVSRIWQKLEFLSLRSSTALSETRYSRMRTS